MRQSCFFPANGPCNDVWKRDALMFVIIRLSNFKIRLSMVLVLGTFAADRRESITGDLVQ